MKAIKTLKKDFEEDTECGKTSHVHEAIELIL
jgi:hypothetical protein